MKLLRLSSPAAKLVIALAGHKVLRLYGRALKYGVTVRRMLVAWVILLVVVKPIVLLTTRANPNLDLVARSLNACAGLVDFVLFVALISIVAALWHRSRYRDVNDPPPRVSFPV